MELIKKYLQKHESHIKQIFESIGKDGKIEAAKVFNFIQISFDQQEFRFQLNGKNFFEEQQNATQMEKLLQAYYRQVQGDQSKKFYLYRVQFSMQEITQILDFWLQREQKLKIVYIQQSGQGKVALGSGNYQANQYIQQNKTQIKNKQETNEDANQFEIDDDNIPNIIKQYQQKIKQLQQKRKQMTKNSQQNSQQINKINEQIDELLMKIKVLQQRIRTSSLNKIKNTSNVKQTDQSMQQSSRTVDSPTSSRKKITVNYKALFQFYAKQAHLTGVKASFERIEHQSQSINYQKLVHFLRQYNLLPASGGDKKKVHALYIKFCEHTRDLNFTGFMNILDGIACLLCPDKQKDQRMEFLRHKIVVKNEKNSKILNHPFHSLQKQDFRINMNQINYSFKLKAQDGRFIHQVNNSIQKRKQDNSEAKAERYKQKQHKKIRYLKKLQSIDPFNPLLVKNAKYFQQKPKQYQPIASLQNIQQYRDNSFDFQNHFGFDSRVDMNNQSENANKIHYDMKRQHSLKYKKSQQTQKRVQMLQKQQNSKMQNYMSGIIERNNAKLQKMKLSPTKLQKSVKFT